jgi:hypothetical protein
MFAATGSIGAAGGQPKRRPTKASAILEQAEQTRLPTRTRSRLPPEREE